MATDDRAIVVGVQCYPGLGDLSGPETDAQAFYDWLIAPAGGDVPKDNVTLINSSFYHPPFRSPSAAAPKPGVVQDAFDELYDIAETNSKKRKGMRVGRRLYLYMAGHGFAPNLDEAALLMANASRERVGYHILGKKYADWFFQAGLFDEIVLIMDCCRENYPLAPLNVPPYMPATDPDAMDRVKYLHIFATKWSRLSRERVMDDGHVRGVFTQALLAGLSGAACDPVSGKISAGSLSDYLINNMKNFLKPEDLDNPDIPKEPDIHFNPKHRDSFELLKLDAPEFPIVLRLQPDQMGKSFSILDNTFKQVASDSPSALSWRVPLKRGTYLALAADGSVQMPFEVRGTGGEEHVDL